MGQVVRASLQSDVRQSATALEAYQKTNDSYPTNCSSAGTKSSQGNVLACEATSSEFCVASSRNDISYYATNTSLTPREGICLGVVGIVPPPEPASWAVSTLAGDGTAGFLDGQATATRFNLPNGIALTPSGSLYVADMNNHRLRKITPGGTVSTIAGSGTRGVANGAGTVARLSDPVGVAVDSTGAIYISDTSGPGIRKITSEF